MFRQLAVGELRELLWSGGHVLPCADAAVLAPVGCVRSSYVLAESSPLEKEQFAQDVSEASELDGR